ncbi:MAG: 6-hydroxymethylpterin diphosphokinase MptE-like protein, partial [Nostocaceae cyanobacterium]|nr:6-hydroxymethylpterin diphosphokinase MptE-like protein [Nostocaceae cyanobacterium]
KCKGKKAVIICNGPSLLKSDLSCLADKEIFTFGLNKINLLFDKSDFRPSCIIAVNYLVLEQNHVFYNNTDIPLFLDSSALKLVKPKQNTIFLHTFGSRQLSFARDCSMSVSQGATVTFVAMQLAFHLGFQHVALIGCDHNFATKGPAHATAIAEEKDVNHFDPNYFAGGVKWNLPDLAMSEAAYSLAYEVYTSFGRKLLNATEGGSLNLLPRVDLKQFVTF